MDKLVTDEERQLANIFNQLNIDYSYEPHCFILKIGNEGRPTKAFRPDFYLPEIDLYVEVTANSNPHKRSKARQCMAIYPYIRVFLLDQGTLACFDDENLNKELVFQLLLENFLSTTNSNDPAVLEKDYHARPKRNSSLVNNLQLKRIWPKTLDNLSANDLKNIQSMKLARANGDFSLAHSFQRQLLLVGYDRVCLPRSDKRINLVPAVIHPSLYKVVKAVEQQFVEKAKQFNE